MTERILITGGTGTLGHAIVMKAEQENWPVEFTIYARSELRLSAMKHRFPGINTIIGDVRDYDKLLSSVIGHDKVIHAAAMKRIPECEASPRECYLTNVIGSDNVARACYGRVGQVVGISTDKACQAVTTYGASKLMMESIFLSYHQKKNGTLYNLVRYGNVVASNGSIIPLWERQYNRKQKLTITDMSMTRFWMSPFDAVRTIQSAWNHPGKIYVPKVSSCYMSKLAAHMFPNCEFEDIGLRSNEKLHEDLVSMDETVTDFGNAYLIGCGKRGSSYKSSTASLLDMKDFARMLSDAEAIER